MRKIRFYLGNSFYFTCAFDLYFIIHRRIIKLKSSIRKVYMSNKNLVWSNLQDLFCVFKRYMRCSVNTLYVMGCEVLHHTLRLINLKMYNIIIFWPGSFMQIVHIIRIRIVTKRSRQKHMVWTRVLSLCGQILIINIIVSLILFIIFVLFNI